MKAHSAVLFSVFAMATFAGGAHGSVFIETFETGYVLGDMQTQGWNINDTTPDASYLDSYGVAPWGSLTATLGFVSPLTTGNVYLSHNVSTPLIGGSMPTSFSTLFTVQDSNSLRGSATRDTFGFSLRSSSGTNLFSFFLNPPVIDETHPAVVNPESDTEYMSYSWSSGVGAPTVALPGYKSEEGHGYTLAVNFFDAGAGNVGFNADINGLGFSGTLLGMAGETIDQFGATWTPTAGPSGPGTNILFFDNISVVPEPSAALLGALGALALVRRRRR